MSQLSDRLGLSEALSTAMAPTRRRTSGHDPGHVLRDLAVMLADGGDCISDLAVLREQSALFGEVASTATAWRVLDSIDDDGLDRLRAARAAARRTAWAAGAAPVRVVLDIDATLVTAHSEKEGATAHYKRGFGQPGPGPPTCTPPSPPSTTCLYPAADLTFHPCPADPGT